MQINVHYFRKLSCISQSITQTPIGKCIHDPIEFGGRGQSKPSLHDVAGGSLSELGFETGFGIGFGTGLGLVAGCAPSSFGSLGQSKSKFKPQSGCIVSEGDLEGAQSRS